MSLSPGKAASPELPTNCFILQWRCNWPFQPCLTPKDWTLCPFRIQEAAERQKGRKPFHIKTVLPSTSAYRLLTLDRVHQFYINSVKQSTCTILWYFPSSSLTLQIVTGLTPKKLRRQFLSDVLPPPSKIHQLSGLPYLCIPTYYLATSTNLRPHA